MHRQVGAEGRRSRRVRPLKDATLVHVTPARGLGPLQQLRHRAKAAPERPRGLGLDHQAKPGILQHLAQHESVVFLHQVMARQPTGTLGRIFIEKCQNVPGPALLDGLPHRLSLLP